MKSFWLLVEQQEFQKVLELSAQEYSNAPQNIENALFLSSLLDEFGQMKASEEILGKLLNSGHPFKSLLPLLFDFQKKFYLLRKSPQTLRRLKIYTYFDPSNTRLLEECLELNVDLSQSPNSDIVFYTGTPFLKPFSPEDLKQQGLGGSETAFVMMAKLLSREGYRVSCFCNTPEIKTYEGVHYYPVENFFLYEKSHVIPIFIASRFLHPLEQKLQTKKKILWLHESLGCAAGENIQPHIQNIDIFFGLSDYQIERICSRHSIPKEKFHKTKNGFITEDFPPLPSSVYRLPSSLIYFSRPERGLKEALKVFDRLKKDFPDLILKVCTYTQKEKIEDDPQLAPLLPLLRREGVEFLGSLSKRELAKTLQETQVFLYPNVTDSETSCIAAMEAMAAGCVVVSSDRGALPETLGEAGVLVPFEKGDEDFLNQLYLKTKELLQNEEERKRLSEKSRHRAWTIYPWEKVAEEWKDFFKKSL